MSEEKRNEHGYFGLGRVFLSVPLFIPAVTTEAVLLAFHTVHAVLILAMSLLEQACTADSLS